MRAIWKGAVAFGLVNVPVKLYAATGEKDVPLHQVHREDGGRIRYKKTCSVDGEPVEMSDIAKGYQTDDGRLVVLDDDDMAQLPLTTEREISVLEFVPAEQVDPIMLSKTYYLEPDKTAAKPYALLREALATTDRMAVVKVALRQRESMAVLRVRDNVICLQTLLWPDEIREADFPILDADVTVRPQELTMASSLVESLAGDFDPSEFHDSYREALESLIEAKVSTGSTQAVPTPAGADDDAAGGGGEVIDLLSALQRSVEKARGARGGTATDAAEDAGEADPAQTARATEEAVPAPRKRAAPKTAARKAATADDADETDDAPPAKRTTSSRSPTRKPAKSSTKSAAGAADAGDDDKPARSRKTSSSSRSTAATKDGADAKESTTASRSTRSSSAKSRSKAGDDADKAETKTASRRRAS
ncbi:Ku protein [Cellulomonas sp. ATA003]|uniref:non-homologous end joining protein Ku n=1 Tax=Cellulomonas sp. ATA003 TaxID=3073064 RepID=UPI00287306A5|nr:Ku protein [Cellulomonas sp. ATA003]WNB84358.1 Ku protein [Cellulomonas sp. ATA003]